MKLDRIENGAKKVESKIDTTAVCENVLSELNRCLADLKEVDHQFYSNIIKLKKEIDKNGESINIDWNKENKGHIYKILEDIFIKLDELDAVDNSSNTIRKKWKSYKKKWSKKDTKYILYTDVPQLVREYLNKFFP